jgi:hypothetical protein
MGLGNLAFLIDDVGNAARVLVLGGLASSVGQSYGTVGVAKQRKGESVLFSEAAILSLRIEADPEDLGVLRRVLSLEVPEPGTLARSARGVGLRIKPEHHLLPAQIAQANGRAVVVGGFEIGSHGTRLKHARLPTSQRLDDAANGHAFYSNCDASR